MIDRITAILYKVTLSHIWEEFEYRIALNMVSEGGYLE